MQEENSIQHHVYNENSDEILSIVAPAYNEEEVLPEFHKNLSGVLEALQITAEVI